MAETVDRELDLDVPPEVVWPEIADPARLGAWLDATIEGDLREGGSAEFRLADGEVRQGIVRDVQEGRRLAFSWWPLDAPAAATMVVISLGATTAGGCRVHVTETRLPRLRAAA